MNWKCSGLYILKVLSLNLIPQKWAFEFGILKNTRKRGMLFGWILGQQRAKVFRWLYRLYVSVSELWRYTVWWKRWFEYKRCARGWGCVCVRFGRPASIMRMDSFVILLVHRTGLFRNYLFSAENIPFKTGWFQKFQIQRLDHLCFKDKLAENIPFKTGWFQKFGFWASAKSYFKDKSVKNISFKTAEGKNGREILTTWFLDILKMSILPFARGSFENMKFKTPKMGLWPLCSQNAFSALKNCDWTFLGVGSFLCLCLFR